MTETRAGAGAEEFTLVYRAERNRLRRVVSEVEEAGLLEAAGGAMDGTGDVSVIVGAADLLEDQGWPAFLDGVEETLAAES